MLACCSHVSSSTRCHRGAAMLASASPRKPRPTYGKKIFSPGYFTCSVALETEEVRHLATFPYTVISYPYSLNTATLDFHRLSGMEPASREFSTSSLTTDRRSFYHLAWQQFDLQRDYQVLLYEPSMSSRLALRVMFQFIQDIESLNRRSYAPKANEFNFSRIGSCTDVKSSSCAGSRGRSADNTL